MFGNELAVKFFAPIDHRNDWKQDRSAFMIALDMVFHLFKGSESKWGWWNRHDDQVGSPE
jgi:hypothetical protein